VITPAEPMKTALKKERSAFSLQMLAAFVRKDSARFLLDVEPTVLSSVQPAALATKKIVKMRGLASG